MLDQPRRTGARKLLSAIIPGEIINSVKRTFGYAAKLSANEIYIELDRTA